METYQLKRIIIIILALVNLSLLGLLGQSALQDRRSRQQMLTQLKDLYLSSGVELTLETLPRDTRQGVSSVQRSAEAERRFSEAFLGSVSVQESGSAMLYSSALGTMRLRRNSAFTLQLTQRTLGEEDALALLKDLGYDSPVRSRDGSTITLTQTLHHEPVLGATVTLHFQDSLLCSAEGYYLSARQEENGATLCSAADALSSFLERSLADGFVYRQISAMHSAQRLSVETLFQSSLLPVWVIETDAAVYLVSHDGDEITPLSVDST